MSKGICCLVFALCLLMTACVDDSVEGQFFAKPYRTASTRIKQYSLEDQYRIFRYGYVRVHPPLLQLVDPVAEHGQAIIPLLLREMNSENDDVALSGIFIIFEAMQRNGNYDVEADKSLMRKLEQRASSMKSWRNHAENSLARLRAGK